jgi:hypothetical protein
MDGDTFTGVDADTISGKSRSTALRRIPGHSGWRFEHPECCADADREAAGAM